MNSATRQKIVMTALELSEPDPVIRELQQAKFPTIN